MTRCFRYAFAAFACMLAAASAFAQGYPARPIRMLVPFSAGGNVDIVARVVGAKLAADLRQPFVVENKAGAGGTIGVAMLAKSPGDGYTLMMMNQALGAARGAGRPAARRRQVRREPLAGPAGAADHRRSGRARLRIRDLVWNVRPGHAAEGTDRAAQHGRQQGARRCRAGREARAA